MQAFLSIYFKKTKKLFTVFMQPLKSLYRSVIIKVSYSRTVGGFENMQLKEFGVCLGDLIQEFEFEVVYGPENRCV